MIRAGPSRASGDSIEPMAQIATNAQALASLQSAHRACRRCVDAGFIARAHPVFSGDASQRILLVGQAPGPVESDAHRPFAGRAGRQLMRWFIRSGFADEDDVRARVYMTSMTTCFPGRRLDGSGDRRPSPHEVALCSSWLDQLLPLLEPALILPVGSLALTRFLPGRTLDEVVGRAYTQSGALLRGAPLKPPLLLPLPHPSGQSRWLNDAARAARLEQALVKLRSLLQWVDETTPPEADSSRWYDRRSSPRMRIDHARPA
jgi:uracil-DNA glycosylase